MAGAGFKTWSTGDVLTASDVNTYLMQQTVMAFADATARDAAVTSPTDGMICFLTGSSALQYHDGSSWTSIDLAGDITGVTAGTLLDGGGTTGTVTLNVDLSEASTSTSDADGDYFIVTDAASAQYKLTKANIALSGMNNDSGWTANAGTVTGVTGTSPVASSGGTAPAISVDTQDANFVLAGQVFSG